MGYDFGSGNDVDIAEVAITASSATPETAPRTFTIESSDDNSSYTVEKTVTLEPSWSAGEQRLYTVAAPSGADLAGDAVSTADATGVLQNKGTFSLPVQHIIEVNTGVFSLPVEHRIIEQGTFSLPVRHIPQAANQGNTWQLVVMLDGVDISAQITGSVEIEPWIVTGKQVG